MPSDPDKPIRPQAISKPVVVKSTAKKPAKKKSK